MKRINKALSIIMMAALVFAAVPAAGGNAFAASAKKPARVGKVWVSTNSSSVIKVSWQKVKKGLNGYTVYRNGKAVRTVAKSVTSITDTGLEPSTRYTYTVRAYKNAKVKQWFNKKTQKWQTKKPAKKYRGKSRKVNTKLYGKVSAAVSLNTKGDPLDKTYTTTKTKRKAKTVKARDCPVTFTEEGTECPICGKGWEVTVTYSNGGFKETASGYNYTGECHHCVYFELAKCESEEVALYFVRGELVESNQQTDSGYEINGKTGEKKSDQTCRHHIHKAGGEECTSQNPDLEDGKTRVFCKTCNKIVNKNK